jgi:hypothetical protein
MYALDQALDPSALGEQLRTVLGLDLIPKPVLLQPETLLRELVRQAERLNVTVIQVQRVDIAEMRGFSLGDGSCPIVALNGADWPRGKVYTCAYTAYKAAEKERNAGQDSPIFYQVKRRDLGRRFISQMVTAFEEDALSSRDLAQLLEVSYDKIPKLLGLTEETA